MNIFNHRQKAGEWSPKQPVEPDQHQPNHRWSSFFYMSDSRQPSKTQPSPIRPEAMTLQSSGQFSWETLATRKVGDRVQIVALNCDTANSRLMALGLLPGVVVEVVSSTATGSVIIALLDQRLGLGAEMAQCIQVSDLISSATDNINLHHGDGVQLKMPAPANPTAPVKLRDVQIGTKLRVVGYEPTSRDYKRKLLAMGLTSGTELLVKRHAPLGDPTEIEVRGFSLTLRKDEADALAVEVLSGAAV